MTPNVIENKKTGEVITVLQSAQDTGGEYIEFEVRVPAGFHDIPMHSHPLQDEDGVVVSGRVGMMIDGHSQTLKTGDSLRIPKGSPHRWWNAGDGELVMRGRVIPPLHFLEIIGGIYDSANAHHSSQPSIFDAVYILRKYSDEYDFLEIPRPLQMLLFPLIYMLGRVLGKYRKYDS